MQVRKDDLSEEGDEESAEFCLDNSRARCSAEVPTRTPGLEAEGEDAGWSVSVGADVELSDGGEIK